jgi:pseudouridine-5'-phosphate glycosidase
VAKTTLSRQVVQSERVASALREGAPVVALESTIITHGLPHPENVQAAIDFERTLTDAGAVPATIAVLDGVVHVGVQPDQLERLAAARSALKLSARDLPVALARGVSGGTTVVAGRNPRVRHRRYRRRPPQRR